MVAFTAPPASFDELRQLFKTIDTDSSGTISYDELKTALASFPEIPEARQLAGSMRKGVSAGAQTLARHA